MGLGIEALPLVYQAMAYEASQQVTAQQTAAQEAEAAKRRQAAARASEHRASLKRKRVHELRGLCGELAVEANGTKAQMIERIVAARTAPPAEPLASGAPPGEASTDAPDVPPAAATAVSGIPAGETSADERAAEALQMSQTPACPALQPTSRTPIESKHMRSGPRP